MSKLWSELVRGDRILAYQQETGGSGFLTVDRTVLDQLGRAIFFTDGSGLYVDHVNVPILTDKE